METNTYRFEKKRRLVIYCLGDWHIGSVNSEKERIETAIKMLAEDEDAVVITYGDLADCILPRDRRYDVEDVDEDLNNVGEQYGWIEDVLKPVKDKILGMHIGNHGTTFAKMATFNETKKICERFGCDFLTFSALSKIKIKNHSFMLHSCHGWGGGYTKGAIINKMAQQPLKFEADVYSMGHSHQLSDFIDCFLYTDSEEKLKYKYRYLVNTGSFLRTYVKGVSGYAEQKQYQPLVIGFAKIMMEEDKIHIEKVVL